MKRRVGAACHHEAACLGTNRLNAESIGNRLCGGPGPQQRIQRGQLRITRGALRKHLYRRHQCSRSRIAQTHRFTQIAHHARACHFGQIQRRGGQRLDGEAAVERIARQVQVARCGVCTHGHAIDLRGAAIGTRHQCLPGDGVAIAQVHSARGRCQADAGDVLLSQREQLCALADAVLVQVLPEPDLSECGIGCVEHTIIVGIEPGQRCKACRGIHRIDTRRARQQGIDAEQLAPAVDQAIAIAVQHQPGIVGLNPARAGAYAIGVVVEEDRRGTNADRFDAVAVEVDRQRIAEHGGWQGVAEVGVGGGIAFGFRLLRNEDAHVAIDEVIDHHHAACAGHREPLRGYLVAVGDGRARIAEVHPQLQVSALGDQGAIAIELALIQPEPVGGFAADDGVGACVGRDHVEVGVCATDQGVVARATIEGVCAVVAFEVVGAALTAEDVVACATVEAVGQGLAVQ